MGLIVWFQKISIPMPMRVIENSKGGGRGSQKQEYLKESMNQNWNFQSGGGGIKTKITSLGRV